jgi:hypothetical protein
MIGMTRGPVTLIAAGTAGLLVWVASRISDSSTGGYWGEYGVLGGAGLLLALSQLVGGWTKWGRPTISLAVFLVAFLPALACVGWTVLAHQPHSNWFRTHVRAWSGDIGIDGLVDDLRDYLGVLAFGLGLVLGLTFDTAPADALAPAGEPLPAREPVPVGNRANRPSSVQSAPRRRVRIPSR